MAYTLKGKDIERLMRAVGRLEKNWDAILRAAYKKDFGKGAAAATSTTGRTWFWARITGWLPWEGSDALYAYTWEEVEFLDCSGVASVKENGRSSRETRTITVSLNYLSDPEAEYATPASPPLGTSDYAGELTTWNFYPNYGETDTAIDAWPISLAVNVPDGQTLVNQRFYAGGAILYTGLSYYFPADAAEAGNCQFRIRTNDGIQDINVWYDVRIDEPLFNYAYCKDEVNEIILAQLTGPVGGTDEDTPGEGEFAAVNGEVIVRMFTETVECDEETKTQYWFEHPGYRGFYGIIQAGDPYGDNRYVVKRATVSNAGSSTAKVEYSDAGNESIIVTNNAEAAAGTHSLAPDTVVRVYPQRSPTSNEHQPQYVMNEGGAGQPANFSVQSSGTQDIVEDVTEDLENCTVEGDTVTYPYDDVLFAGTVYRFFKPPGS